ncbi:MAG: phosphoethanolamine--lipid A transferase [Pseudohongiella sp.]|nr:phosphoethanolamine--lipid A transferase [Pseudohongiella sp.]
MSALRTTGSNGVILVAALFFTIAYNLAFFRNVYATYSEPGNAGFLISLSLVLISSIAVFLAVALNKFTLKPALMLLFPVAAAGSYFMNSYNVIIDSAMIQNSVMTDSREVFDLLSLRLLLYVALLGVLPAFLVYKLPLRCDTPLREITARFKLIAVLLVVIAGNLFLMADQYTSFIREHKDLRYYMNPLTLIYSSVKYVSSVAEASAGPRAVIGNDAYIDRDSQVRKLVVLIVGEATRADHWSLNGYERETNDALLVHDIVNFPEVSSCATSTAFSVPCMFSLSTFDNFKLGEAKAQENVLDVLSKVGANVLWRDNNSDSKGVAIAVAFEDFRSPEVNPVCDTECRDIGMLSGLDDYITQHPEGDIVVVLHQMGNHGPAYYKRYPKAFERYTPVCESNQLEKCTREEIVNAYDNALAYSSHFLASVIEFLMPYQTDFSTAMFYMADHGESLGEMGLYLHGLPYAIAPEAQTHVAAMMWLGDDTAAHQRALAQANSPLSHDNYFHTVLGLLDVRSEIYDADLNVLAGANQVGFNPLHQTASPLRQ